MEEAWHGSPVGKEVLPLPLAELCELGDEERRRVHPHTLRERHSARVAVKTVVGSHPLSRRGFIGGDGIGLLSCVG